MAVCKKYYAQKDKYGFPIPGTMEGFHKPYPSLKRGLFELKNFEYTPTPCECREYHPEGLRFFVKVDKYGNIIANSLFAARKKPLGVHTIEQIVYCEKFSCVIIPMKNFLNTDTPGYPVGVWNTAGTYLGTADNQSDYITLWNSDVTNQAQGTLLPGSTSTEFYIADTPSVTVSFVRGLRYYMYKAPANIRLYIGVNDIVKYGSTTLTGAVNGFIVDSDSTRDWNRYLLGGTRYKTKIPQTNVLAVNCTGYTDSSNLYVFHNDDTEYWGPSYTYGFYYIEGAVPKNSKAICLIAGQFNTNYNLVNNWQELTSLWSFPMLHGGGGPWRYDDPSYFPALYSNSITQLNFGSLVLSTLNYAASFINQTNYPNVSELSFNANNSAFSFSGSENWFLNMPKVNRYLSYVKTQTNQETTAVADLVWNNIATNLTGITPVVGSQAELAIRRTSGVSAASLASRTYLAAQGWTIVLN